ncbi:F-box domain-containing protein [Mycena venus]|uniref:F-box domain-containing protein n=1 Tax=Mycena venus TaxID=2733690 RepID=A0A8H6YFU6_9AGAR|nr:F-box domain-containing protein [Mycena venus]
MSEIPCREQVLAQISATEANIRRLTTEIDELESQRQKERRAVGRLWFMILPVGTLPTELLLEIFALAVQSRTDVDRRSPPYGPDHPIHQTLLLSHVCSLWRQIVLTSPRLWVAGLIDVRLDRKGYLPRNLARLTMLLDRSSPLPLTVSLAGGKAENGADPARAAILHALIPTVSRWKDLKAGHYSFFNELNASPGSFTALEKLDIHLRSNQLHLFSTSSHLRYLRLVMEDRMSPGDVLRIPWAQLTHLDLEESNPTTCRLVLLQCTNVVSARFQTTFDWDTNVDAPATVLPFLQTLKVQLWALEVVGHIGPLLGPLTLPALQSFRILGGEVWPAQEFSTFQMRAPNISQIFLTRSLIASEELVTLLRLAPALTSLTLMSCARCINDPFLQAFTYDVGDGNNLVPHLHDLRWQSVGYHHLDYALFESAIRSRCSADVTPLKQVIVDGSSFRRLPVAQMQDLKEKGLELHII